MVTTELPRSLYGQVRRSYLLWQDRVAPLIMLEFVSGDGAEERDRTPFTGEFWVYEQKAISCSLATSAPSKRVCEQNKSVCVLSKPRSVL